MEYFYQGDRLLSIQELIVFIVAADYFDVDIKIKCRLGGTSMQQVMSHMQKIYPFIKYKQSPRLGDNYIRFQILHSSHIGRVAQFNLFVKKLSNLSAVASRIDLLKDNTAIADNIHKFSPEKIQLILEAIHKFLEA